MAPIHWKEHLIGIDKNNEVAEKRKLSNQMYMKLNEECAVSTAEFLISQQILFVYQIFSNCIMKNTASSKLSYYRL